MSEDTGAASNAATNDVVQSDAAPQVAEVAQEAVTEEKPAGSAREAVERAMAKMGQEQPSDNRDPATGKFTKKQEQQAQAAQAAPKYAPPQRFAKQAQEAWGQVPEAVQAEIDRAIAEMTGGIEKYKPAAESYEQIRKFEDMAKSHGVSLPQALENYVAIDQMLARDPLNGVLQVCQKCNINPVVLAQAILGQQGGQPDQSAQHVIALQNEIQGLKQQLSQFGESFAQREQQALMSQSLQTVEKFVADKPYFSEVAQTVEQLIATGFAGGETAEQRLADAYEKAIRLTPDVLAKIEADKAKTAKPDPAQTREKANKSITGTPSPGSNPTNRKVPGSAREALQNAFAQAGLG